MPASGFFRRFGFFVAPNFLDAKCGAELCRAMAGAPSEEPLIVVSSGEDRCDEDVRRVDVRVIPKHDRSRTALRQRLRGLIPELETHFCTPLVDCESPQYLIYHPGDFFRAHRDGGDSAPDEVTRRRRVSVVIFLNRESEEPAGDAYGQGHLTFHQLLDGPHWGRCAFPLDAEPGLLIAFPSSTLHEVTPVSHGRRFTVVTWFYDSSRLL
jgi:SM-20-related protein